MREMGEDKATVVALLKKTSAWMPRTLRGLVLISMLVLELVEWLVEEVVKDGYRSGVCVLGICHALGLLLLHGDGPNTKEYTTPRKKMNRKWTVDGPMMVDIATCSSAVGWWLRDVTSLAAC
mgnify:FL=1